MSANAKWIKCIIAIRRFIPLATILSLVLIMLSGTSLAQPTLKKLLEEPAEKEQGIDQPKNERG